jgi:PEP-CTERM motif-containing protein
MELSLRLAVVLAMLVGANAHAASTTYYFNSSLQLLLESPTNVTETVTLTGFSTIYDEIGPGGAVGDSDANGEEDAITRITTLSLTGTSTTLGLGVITLHLDGVQPDGRVQEFGPGPTPGILDVFPYTPTGTVGNGYQIFYAFDSALGVMKSGQPQVLGSQLDHWPPGPGDSYSAGGDFTVFLTDGSGNPNGWVVLKAIYTPGLAPEPATFALLGLAGLGLMLARSRRS